MPITDPQVLTVMPSGFIVRWCSSTQIPSGWVLCDGNNNTPNLVKSFAMGKNISDPAQFSSTHTPVFIMKN
jgi:hypothetical protein